MQARIRIVFRLWARGCQINTISSVESRACSLICLAWQVCMVFLHAQFDESSHLNSILPSDGA